MFKKKRGEFNDSEYKRYKSRWNEFVWLCFLCVWKICELTEGRIISLDFFLNNVNAKHVNVALFKSVFNVSSFDEIMKLLTDEDRFNELREFGDMMQVDFEKEQASILSTNMELVKTPIE